MLNNNNDEILLKRKPELTQQQKKALEALLYVDGLCREHEISYFLMAGTVLGAIRHGGFIPWDDDVDIGMTLDNAERFNTIVGKYLPEGYYWSHPSTNRSHPRYYGKLLYKGKQCLDVFLLVKTSDKYLKRRLQWLWHKYLLYGLYRKTGYKMPQRKERSYTRIFLIRFLSILAAMASRHRLDTAASRCMRLYETEKDYMFINLCSRYSMKKEEIMRSWVETTGTIIFEGYEFPAFADTDGYLTHLYGDYMTLPPPEKRISFHENMNIKITKTEER